MVQAVLQSKKALIVLGAALALLLAVACGSDSDGDGTPGTAGNISAAGLSKLLAAAGGPEAAARLLQSGSGASTGIWVSGTGMASGAPDLGVINLGVEALADSAADARAQAASAIERTIAVLKNNGIEERDIRTSHFNISPRYTTREVTKCADGTDEGPAADGNIEPALGAPARAAQAVEGMKQESSRCTVEFEQVLTGYQVNNTLSVKVRELDGLGGIIDGVTDAAGDLTRINGINFTMEDSKPLQAQARQEAIADLLAKANAMAELAGVGLGKLVFLTETGGGTPAPFARAESAAGFGFASNQSTSILAGELDVTVSVQGVFDIAPAGN